MDMFRWSGFVVMLALLFYPVYHMSTLYLVSSSNQCEIEYHSIKEAIDACMRLAEMKMADMISRQTQDFEDTARAYRSRRNQDPPPGFRQWYDFARNASAILIEDIWDPIYEDLEVYARSPFPLGRSRAAVLREAADDVSRSTLCPEVKGFSLQRAWHGLQYGEVTTVESSCEADNLPCLEIEAMLDKVARFLPSMNIPINDHASPRIIVPHSDRHAETSHDQYHHELVEDDGSHFPVLFDRARLAIDACPPASPLGSLSTSTVRQQDDPRTYHRMLPESNSTSIVCDSDRWRDVCHQPWLLNMHGALVRPMSRQLLPLFAPAKLAGIEIALRYPDTIYWARNPDYNVDEIDNVHDESQDSNLTQQWLRKMPVAFWRGTNTGGGHHRNNWHRFHRHRFVASTNATWLRSLQSEAHQDWTRLSYTVTDRIFLLADNHTDVGFASIACHDNYYESSRPNCSYLSSHFMETSYWSLPESVSRHRFLFDVDGNSFSGRFYALLSSNSVVLKATVFQEWHDARLIPWLHFIPISNNFGRDMWDVLEYFLENENQGAKVASEAKRWAEMVLRSVDMEIYLFRLLLEWARLIDAW